MKFHPEWDEYVSFKVLACTLAVYLTSVFMLKSFMKNQEPFGLQYIMRAFNLVQITLSCVMCWKLSGGFSLTNPFMLNAEFTEHTERWLFIHFLAKYWDLLETGFIVLRKRDSQLTNLHLFHHSSILILWGWLLNISLANGTATYGALINSFVHAVMSGHRCSNGDAHCMSVINKNSVVLCQVWQFLSCILHAVSAIFFDDTIPKQVCLVQLLYNVLLVALFLREGHQVKKKQDARKTVNAALLAMYKMKREEEARQKQQGLEHGEVHLRASAAANS